GSAPRPRQSNLTLLTCLTPSHTMAAKGWRSGSSELASALSPWVVVLPHAPCPPIWEGVSMARRLTSRLALPWLLSLCVLVGLSAPATAGATSSSGCDNRVNDTPRKLVPCISTDDLWNHMKALQAIADNNLGADGHPSRNSGEPGYKASVDYV